MKKTLISIIYFLACILSIQAQTLFGTTINGGNEGAGTLNKFITATNSLTAPKSFESIDYYPYNTNLIQATDGKLYGMTFNGGSLGYGVIFSFDPASLTYTKLKDFDGVNGGSPIGSLMQASDGKLYGMTPSGGSGGGSGVIFSFDLSSSTYTRLMDFDNTNGDGPLGSLIQADDGKLYGMTISGGSVGAGVIFSFDPSTFAYTKLKDFDNINGAAPEGTLLKANDGKLYGLTVNGGINNSGVIFSFDPLDSTFTKLKDFDSTNGGYPVADLIQASDGKLYGMTVSGGITGTGENSFAGVIFSFDPSASTYTKLKDFSNADGSRPYGSLMQARDGKLYGMTSEGGNFGHGVIFSFDPVAFNYKRLEDFNDSSGASPFASILQAGDGKLYGMTFYGGTSGRGVIFSFDPLASIYTKLKDFGTNESGRNPSASLVQARDGKLYGLTISGGSSDVGVIYSFDPLDSIYTKLKDFDGANGANPYGSLIQASDGKLYGMTSGGGSSGDGVIFSFDPSSSTYTKLKDFDYASGTHPYGSLMQANDGKLYGMTRNGGSSTTGGGVIFSFDPSASTYTKLMDFDFTNGASPYGSLIQASNGKLYGMTNGGGNGNVERLIGIGVIFSFDPSNSGYAKLKDFTEADGYYPYGSLMQAGDGKLYGMAQAGGNRNVGVMFSFDPLASTYTRLIDFGIDNGVYPYGNLMQASDGKLYGSTNLGRNGHGTIFSFDPSALIFTTVKEYDGSNGANPYFGSAFIEVTGCVADKTFYQDADGDGFGNPDSAIKACIQPAGYVTNNLDCDDNNKAGHAPSTYYRDADGDGYGDGFVAISMCNSKPPAGYVKNDYDCDDHKKANKPWNERVRMCHNGVLECVYAKEIFKKLWKGWTLGLCPAACDNRLSKAIAGASKNAEMYSKEQSIPREYKLSNYPNPFAGTSTIKYELPFDSKVSIKVYDLLGRAVATLVDENKKAGTYTVNFNAGRISHGSLYYRIIAVSKDDQFEQTNKMIQLR